MEENMKAWRGLNDLSKVMLLGSLIASSGHP